MFTDLGSAIDLLMSPTALVLAAVGSLLGLVVGAIPGLTGAMLIALALPLTYSMQSEYALVLLVSMYVGSVSGGFVTATLLRMPGTPASMMTTMDGYPMAERGQAGRALALGIGGSFIGGMISWGFLVGLAQPMAAWSLTFGPFEFFALVVVAMVLIATVGGKSMSMGLFSGALGVAMAMPGSSPATGLTRLTFGVPDMDDGFKLMPVLIGIFAVNQVMRLVLQDGASGDAMRGGLGTIVEESKLDFRVTDLATHGVNLVRSALIGTWIGILPGIGANVGSVVAYSAAKRSSKTPEAFGHGSEEGVVASETANNATIGGALIPLVAMGIPGSVIDAILLGALVIHGLQPGPMLVQSDPLAVQTIVGSMLIANGMTLCLLLAGVRLMVWAARVPAFVLVPAIMVFCVVGSYALANRMFDVWVMLAFGGIGFVMEKASIPIAPFVIGFVLAPIGEEHLSAGLMQSGGSLTPLLTQPISLALCVVAVGLVVRTLWQRFRDGNRVELPDESS